MEKREDQKSISLSVRLFPPEPFPAEPESGPEPELPSEPEPELLSDSSRLIKGKALPV